MKWNGQKLNALFIDLVRKSENPDFSNRNKCFPGKSGDIPNTPIPCPSRWHIFPNHPLYQQKSLKMRLVRFKAGFGNPEDPEIWKSQFGPVFLLPSPNRPATTKNMAPEPLEEKGPFLGPKTRFLLKIRPKEPRICINRYISVNIWTEIDRWVDCNRFQGRIYISLESNFEISSWSTFWPIFRNFLRILVL